MTVFLEKTCLTSLTSSSSGIMNLLSSLLFTIRILQYYYLSV